MPASQSSFPMVVSNRTLEISPYFLAISRVIIKKNAYATKYQHTARTGSCQPKAVNDENGERSTAFDPLSLSAVLRFSSGAHDATTRTGKRLVKIACQGCPHPHARICAADCNADQVSDQPEYRLTFLHWRWVNTL
jgi:hypothetical protein